MIARGASSADIESLIQQRFPGLPLADARELLSLSEQVEQAGQAIDAQDVEDILDLSLLPVNPLLATPNNPAARIRLVGQNVYSDDTVSPYVYVDLDVEKRIEDILQEAVTQLRNFVVLYERLAQYISKEAELDPSFDFVAAERRF